MLQATNTAIMISLQYVILETFKINEQISLPPHPQKTETLVLLVLRVAVGGGGGLFITSMKHLYHTQNNLSALP